jgi:hypothetical protein
MRAKVSRRLITVLRDPKAKKELGKALSRTQGTVKAEGKVYTILHERPTQSNSESTSDKRRSSGTI